ncbi:MAG: type II secretion system F family protein [Lentisphaeria bacterium]|nr:type II secretion system F family protein [Lentisphaeria bacterium]
MIYTILASICTGIAVSCFLILVFDLASMVELEKQEEMADSKKLPFFIRMFLPLAPSLRKLVQSELFAGSRSRAAEMLEMSSFDQAVAPADFIAVRIIMAALGILLACLMFFGDQPLMGLLILFLFLIYPPTWLKGVIRRRHLSILKALPNMLDLLTLSVEAGKNFLTALRDILEKRPPDPLGEEFLRALREIQLGTPRQQALKAMSNRVRQPDLASVVDSIVQADELGISIGQILKVQGDQLRTKRFARAEKLANEAPVKILFPVVIFIFPSVFLILLGPIISQASKVFGG